jgi:hypothetical protein
VRPISAASLARHRYRCNHCRNSTPAALARYRRYRQSAKGRATTAKQNEQKNSRRIFIGETYHSLADSSGTAHRINAHIKDRLRCRFHGTRGKNGN